MIQIQSLTKSYGSKQVLHGIDLTLEEGKVYGIVGENGAGKTTLFKCIAGFESYEGDIKAAVHPIKNHLGYLSTNPIFLSRVTGWEYLKLLSIARGVYEENFEERNIFDLPLQEYAESYSTGMKKKLALYGILLQQNDIYILDEPFNGVDIHSNMIIIELIEKLKAAGKTVLISSHIFSTLSECCDEIHLLKNGNFVQSATHKTFSALEQQMKSFVIGSKVAAFKV